MMLKKREIKFRGKRADGKWVYGYLVKDDCEYLIGADVDSMFDVVPNTIGQFTGLKDSNGVDIYEGDICLDEINGENCVIVYKYDGFYAEYSGHIIDLYEVNDRITVQDNIHDNPELVKGE